MAKNKKIIFEYGELFCGPGGLAFGAVNSSINAKNAEYKIKHKWATDYDADSCQTYKNNIAKENSNSVICDDIRNIDIKSLPKIDAFAYGFPCNDFSVVGERKGFDGKYGPLYTFGIKVLNAFKPKFFVAENVGGITSANEGKVFATIIHDLENSGNGYNVVAHLYRAEDYGIPQIRHRVIIVGIDKKTGLIFKVPKPTHLNSYITVREALEKPPIPPFASNNELKKQSPVVIERLKMIKPGENVWNATLPKHLRLKAGAARLSQIYKRLDPNKPSYTITGSGGGGTHGYHYDFPRALTNRERARIQTFPDDFVFEGRIESARKQIGMAVPPRLSSIIFSSILKTFAKIPFKSVSPNIKINDEIKFL